MRRLLMASVVLVGVTTGCGGDDHEFAGFSPDPPPQVDAVALPDVSQGGRPFEFRADDGGLLVVYFGYTNCPDVCPTTMSDIGRALGELEDEAERVSVAMVTVDPARDTEVLADYVHSFVPNGHAIATDDDTELRKVAEPFGVTYDVVTGPDGEVEVAHSSGLFAVDDGGQLVLTWPFGTPVDDLAADLDHLLADAV